MYGYEVWLKIKDPLVVKDQLVVRWLAGFLRVPRLQYKMSTAPLGQRLWTVGKKLVLTSGPLIKQGTSNLSFHKQIEQICKFAFHSISLISKIRQFLSMETAKTFSHAFVTSK